MRTLGLTVIVVVLGALTGCLAQPLNKVKHRLSINTKGVLAYSRDQAFLAVSFGKEIHLYAAETFKLSRVLKGHTKDITALSFSPDGKHLLSAGLDKKIISWEFLTGAMEDMAVDDAILAAEMLDETKVALATETAMVIVDIAEKKTLHVTKEHARPIRCMSAWPDGNLVVTGGGDGKVVFYDGSSGDATQVLENGKAFVRAIDVSVDGRYVAAGNDNGSVTITGRDGKVISRFTDAKGWIRSISFSLDGQYVAAGDDWGNIFIYSIEKGVLIEKISDGNVPIGALSFSPDGKELAFVEWQRSVSIWSVPKLNISSVFRLKDERDISAPQIFVSSPPNIQDERIRVYKDLVEIRGTLMDESGIRGLKINGTNVPIKENNNFVLFVPLSMGDNPISIEARDVNDNLSVKRFTIQRKNPDGEQYDVNKAKNYLFVVGINEYQSWPHLNNAVKDAGDIVNTLMKEYNFEFEHLTFLKNEQATRTNIYNGLRALIEKIGPQDNLMIYFSGHGYFDPLMNEGYWIPVEAKTSSIGDYLSNSDLLKIIANINSQHTFLVADACFSGSLFGDSKRGYEDNVERFRSRWGLASGRLEVVSDGEQGKNSPFAEALLAFLKDNKKEKIAVSELVQAVKMKVAEVSQQTPLGNPLRLAGDEGGELVLYRRK